MKEFLFVLFVTLASVGRAIAGDDTRFQALSMLETGNDDNTIGAKGEVSRYQIMPSLWHEYSPHSSDWTDRYVARVVAGRIMRARVARFEKTHRVKPDDFAWALLWHRPATAFSTNNFLSGEARDYATRFENLTKKYSTNK